MIPQNWRLTVVILTALALGAGCDAPSNNETTRPAETGGATGTAPPTGQGTGEGGGTGTTPSP